MNKENKETQNFADVEFDVLDILQQCVEDSGYECPNCGNMVEPDGECYCGFPNPLKAMGMI